MSKGDGNIVYTTREFNGGNFPEDKSYEFVGSSLNFNKENEEFILPDKNKKKLIYVSLGTINNNFAEFYRMCFDVISEMDVCAFMSVGDKVNIKDLGEIPPNFIALNSVPQLKVLSQVDLFISHCGFNSVSESIYYQVPILGIPMVNDQFMVAKRIEALKLGIILDMKEMSKELLKKGINDIIYSTEYKNNAKIFSLKLRKSGGYQKAADYIINFDEKR